ncbi:unnamed protein product [Candidula unifasciata]|uniref:Sulfotransferase domain-containing protein n=1 Tax=Candidula unifasciata TaxID=100452 RepID=A0A8S3ZMG4_9EUPU|nr:unnamed protein product [Candidula unifasciata]
MLFKNRKHDFVTDASGATLNVLKYNGKLYTPGIQGKLLTLPDMRVRKSDVLLCGYPKTGCHWVHEIMHMLVNKKVELTKHGKELGGMIEVSPDIILDSLPSRRVLNTHFLYEELPKGFKENKTKIVYTVRNPKDTVVSYYNHHINLKLFYGYNGNFNDYFQLFMEGNLDSGSYFDHVLAWDKVIRSQTDNPVLLVKFEDIKSDPVEVILRIAEFLDVETTREFAEDVASACHFTKMKAKREKAGSFDAVMFRKGTVGDWRNWLTDEQSQAMDKVWSEKMKDCIYQPVY